ncbi:hypothetical protein FHT44_005200 [Mycolicibacterium sp. BK634]|nr:hypothetical protein [Mycolicibacterium sp. BK634]
MDVDITKWTENTWHVQCPETGDSTTTGSFAEAVLWATWPMQPGDNVNIRMRNAR